MTSTIAIRIARDSRELEEVYRFRYRIYVEEMRRAQLYADHNRRRVEDPLDLSAITLAAWSNEELVGTMRMNLSKDCNLGAYEDFYEMQLVGNDHPARTSLNTRLMVSPHLRKTRLAYHLAIASYEYGMPKGIRWNFIDCNDHLVSFFAGLGYVQHIKPAIHPEYGIVNRMRLEVTNLAHLEAVGSPFARILRRQRQMFERPEKALERSSTVVHS